MGEPVGLSNEEARNCCFAADISTKNIIHILEEYINLKRIQFLLITTSHHLRSLVIVTSLDGKDYIFQQTMYRIKDPKKSLEFYTKALGMTLLQKCDFPEMKFSLYFMGYEDPKDIPDNKKSRMEWAFSRKATLELTHNWGTETNDDFAYHTGNTEHSGYGHIGVMVPDLSAACERMEKLGVPFIKKPTDGKMKAVAFIKDPDGYWIELFNAKGVADMICGES